MTVAHRTSRRSASRGFAELVERYLELGGGAPRPFVGVSEAARRVREKIAVAARNSCSLVLFGETGSGKGWVARLIHDLSERRQHGFVHVTLGALPETLVDAELYGHEKGAFTGAQKFRQGAFEYAREGTIFLDEIAEIPPHLQVKLHRVLDTGEYTRLGSCVVHVSRVRILAATNVPPEEVLATGKLRADLYWRLHGFSIEIPPLRERKEDIPELAAYLTACLASGGGRRCTFTDAAIETLCDHEWRGNIRELKRVIECAHAMSKGSVISEREIVFSPTYGEGEVTKPVHTAVGPYMTDNYVHKSCLSQIDIARATVIARVMNGEPAAKIARELNIPDSTLHHWRKRIKK